MALELAAAPEEPPPAADGPPRPSPAPTLVRHAPAAAFHGALAAALLARFGLERLALRHFDRRIVSEATLDAFDVGARIRLYALCVLAALAVGGASLFAQRRLARRVPEGALAVVRASSAAGLALLVLSLFPFPADGALGLVLVVQALALAAGLAPGAGRGQPSAAYVGWLAGAAVALYVPLAQLLRERLDPADAWGVGCVLALGLGLHGALALATRGEERERRAARWLHAGLALPALALVPFLRDELQLLTEDRGLVPPHPLAIQAALGLALAAWLALRFRRAGRPGFRLELERGVGRLAFPLLLVGALTLVDHRPFLPASDDLLEPANPGLLVQQWLEYGRLPFVETFDVHGLWDSAYALVYAALSGGVREQLGFYDFGKLALPVLLLYLFLRRATGSSYLALFAAALLPYASELAPAYCAPALVAVWALDRAVRRRAFGSYLALFLALAGLAVWRVDIGFAASAAVVLALLAQHLTAPGAGLRWGRAVAAGLLACGLTAGAWIALCALAEVDPLVRFQDLLRVLLSNQGYGHTRIAIVTNEVVRVHLALVPAGVLLGTLALLLQRRRERRAGDPECATRRFLFLGLVFLAGYYFANVPRGLVRHTFLEPGNVYLASFGALFLGLLPWWRLGARRPALAFGALVALTGALALCFPLSSPRTKELAPRRELWGELLARLPVRHAVAPAEEPRARAAAPEDFAQETYGELKRFLDANLAPEATFLDLAHCPMLYLYTHRVSPHWLNHLMCAPGEPSQRRVLAELESFDVPVIVLRQDVGLARQAGLRWIGDALDGVPFRLRHWMLFEHAYERYRPFALLGRWHVWLRDDATLPAPPGEEVTTRLRHEPAGASTLAAADAPRSTTLALSGFGAADGEATLASVELVPDQPTWLRVQGRAGAPFELELRLALRTAAGAREERRTLRFPGGALDRAGVLLVPEQLTALERIEVACPGGLELDALAIEQRRDPVHARLFQRERLTEESALRQLPWVWARYDERRGERATAAVLLAAPTAPAAVGEEAVPVQPYEASKWSRGVHLDEASVMVSPESLRAGLAAGDTLVFAVSGPRRVRQVVGRQVRLEGGPLDPVGDGAPNAARWRRPELRGALLEPGEPLELPLPAARAGRPLPYLVLRAANRSGAARELVLEYGSGEGEPAGRFTLEPRPDREAHEYCLRASVHASWWRRPDGWLRVTSVGGAAELLSVELADGP